MADLTNAKIANTYKDLLQVNAETSNAGLDGTVRTIQDGGGTASPIAMSTAQLNVTGQFALAGTVLTATADQLNNLATGKLDTLTAGDDTVKITIAGVSVSTATVSATVVVNPVLSLTEVDAATGSFNTKVSATNFIAGTGSFTTKVSGVAAEFSGIVSASNIVATSATFNGDVTLKGASSNIVFDKSDNALEFADNAKAVFGDGNDLQLYHDGNNSIIKHAGTGSLLFYMNSELAIQATPNSFTKLFHDGVQKFTTTGSGATITGAIVADAATVDDISLDGKVLTITGDTDDTFKITAGANGATTLATVDTAAAAADLTLDADGLLTLDSGNAYGTINLKYQGTLFGVIYSAEGEGQAKNLVIRPDVDDSDIIFKGKDGGAFITALTLDMSEAGKAIFNAGATFADDVTVENINLSDKVLTITGDTGDTFTITTGAAGDTTLATTDAAGTDGHLRLDADGFVILDGGDTYGQTLFYNKGVSYGNVYENSNSLHLQSIISDGDIIFKGNDGGSFINALTLDMSEAGKAAFNAGATFADDVTVEDINLSGKVLTITGDTSDTFTITSGANGATTLATTDAAAAAGHITLAPDGYIVNNAGVNGTYFQVGGTSYGLAGTNGSTTQFLLRSMVSDGDLIIQGNDGGSTIDALTFDMSEAGAATFNNRVTAAALTVDNIDLNVKTITITGDTNDTFTITSGANGATTLATTDTAGADGFIKLDADGIIVLDAGDASGQTQLKINNTKYGTLFSNGTDFYIKSNVSDGDVIIQGVDGGSAFTALTLDMSAAGKATFNDSISTPALLFLSTDGEKIAFGADTEITIRHVHNSGLQLRNSQTGDVGGFVLTLQSGESEVVTNDVIGTIDFQAYNESSSGDSRLVAAGIEAVAEQTFNSTANTTRLKFKTAVSETATEKMTLTGAGNLGIGTATPLKTLHVDGPALSTVQTLTDASTVTSDFDTGQNFTLTLAGNRTLGAPSNVDAGQVGSIFIIQDGTGSRTLAYNSIWKFAGGTAPTLSTAAGAIDRLDYIVQSGTAIQAVLTKAYA